MHKYVYENAIVYISKPTVEQIENIHKSTERFVNRLAEKGMIKNVKGRNNHRAGRTGSNARKRNEKVRRKS